MAATQTSRLAKMASHGGPGCRKGHDVTFPSTHAPLRETSLPLHGISSGFSPHLGNRLELQHYAELRGRWNARLDNPPHAPAPRKHVAETNKAKVETSWMTPERMKPELQPPAGRIPIRQRGKRQFEDNANTKSHVDSLLFGMDLDGSDGMMNQTDSQLFGGRAGQNAIAERRSIYGDLPPTCHRTFGEHGTTTWDNPRGAAIRPDAGATLAWARLDAGYGLFG